MHKGADEPLVSCAQVVDAEQRACSCWGAEHPDFKYGQGKNGTVGRDTRQSAKNRSDMSQIGAHSRLDEREEGAGLHFGLPS